MMLGIMQLSKIMGISRQYLSYQLAKPDAPIPQIHTINGSTRKFYDRDEVQEFVSSQPGMTFRKVR